MDEDKEIILNRPQALLHLVNANKCYALWGRASGKSSGGLGPRSFTLFEKMPRAQIGLPMPSYVMGFKNILPNIVGFWQNQMGLVEGENYVIGRRPPDDWPKPLIPILDFKYVISFDTGNAMPMLSLEVEGSANGYNLQALIGDEGKFFKEKKLKEIIRAVRGCNKEFGHMPEFQSQWFFSDKYDGDVEWMLNKRSLVNMPLIKAIVKMQLHIENMEAEFELTKNPAIGKEISFQTNRLNNIRKSLVFVSEASAEENREILGDKYFEDQRADSTKIEYDTAIDNKDPDRVENSFYPALTEQHYYNQLHDVDTTRPLMIAPDYQWRISPIVTAQYGILPGAKALSLNFVHSCHELAPLGLNDAIDKWANHYKAHGHKLVYYLFDKTAVGKSSTNKPFFETVVERLKYNGWRVAPINMGETPRHDDKFRMISKFLNGVTGKPQVRINALTNQYMIGSINRTAAITYNGKTSKNKQPEKNLSIPAEKATHYSDCFDMIIYGALDLDLVPRGTGALVGSILS